MNSRSRTIAVAIAVVSLLALSGCATISVTSEVEDADTLSTYDVWINTTNTGYGLMNEAAKEDGYENFSDSVVSQIGVPESKVESSTTIGSNQTRIHITATDVNVSNMTAVGMKVTGGELEYRDYTFTGQDSIPTDQRQYYQGVVVQYHLTMPGEISNSTADEVNGNEATWRETGADAFTSMNVSATSPAPTETSVPGFGPIVAVLALAVSVAAAHRRYRS